MIITVDRRPLEINLVPPDAEFAHFSEGNSSARDNIFTADHVAQCLAGLNQPVDADSVVGHLVIDIGVESSRRGAGREQLRLIELKQGEGDLEKECTSASTAGRTVLRDWICFIVAIFHAGS